MPEDADLETKAPTSERTEVGASGGKSVDYEAKYRGLSKKFTNLEKEKAALETKYDEALGHNEELEAKTRNGDKDLRKQLTEAQSALATAQTDAAKWEKQFKAVEAKATERKLLSDKYPALTDLFDAGDLKSLEQFEKPEDYEAYLGRLAAKIVPQQSKSNAEVEQQETEDAEIPLEQNPLARGLNKRDFLSGATPSVTLGSRDNSKARTMSEIQDSMELLNPNDPEYGKKYLVLEAEMDTRMAADGYRLSK